MKEKTVDNSIDEMLYKLQFGDFSHNQTKYSLWQLIEKELDKYKLVGQVYDKGSNSQGYKEGVNQTVVNCKDALRKLILGEK